MKSIGSNAQDTVRTSHSPRSGWIEMVRKKKPILMMRSPTPHGVGGLKCPLQADRQFRHRPTPHGVGGLKWKLPPCRFALWTSHSPRSGWIEMKLYSNASNVSMSSHSPRSGWIEIVVLVYSRVKTRSHSPRSGWIEIFGRCGGVTPPCVPLPTEWVD